MVMLENSMDREAWQAKVDGVTKNQTLLSDTQHSARLNVNNVHILTIFSNN